MVNMITTKYRLKNDKDLQREIIKQIQELADIVTEHEVLDRVRIVIGVNRVLREYE